VRFSPAFVFFVFVPVCFAQTYLVLPFANRTGQDDLNWVSESMAESLGDALDSGGLLVADRTHREEAYRRLGLLPYARLTRASAMKLGMAIDASVVVFGEIDWEENRLRIAARIVEVKRLAAGGEYVTTGPLDDGFGAMQAKLAWRILRDVNPNATPSESDYLRRFPPPAREAIERYARGFLAPTDDARAALWTLAAKSDPGYLPPAYTLGKLYFARKQWQEAAVWLGRLNIQAPHGRDALFHLGLARFHLVDYDAAADAFSTIAQTVPLNEVFNNLGVAQSRAGKPEAIENFRKALEGDEADPVYHFNLGYELLKRGEGAQAADRFRAVLDRSPNDAEAITLLGRSLKGGAPTPGLERIKPNFDESAYLQLRALIAKPAR
jgi:tetratricopeptide (TPR) repeat protein